MAARSTFLLLVFASLLVFNECNRDIGIDINGDELDQNPTADEKIKLLPCKHYILPTSWCCITMDPQLCWHTQKDCLAHCPPFSPPPHAVP
ncbi:hypothetical protein V6N13_105378 [Hibiscus sabdariffa]|uniref:Uncharacterized protein n=1 Tax=Hibiscus sabdariffa TaxID=183260 RepID=A0ABR2EWP3_9ROSI